MSAETKVKRDELQRVHLRAQSLLDSHKQGLTGEQDLEMSTLLKRAQELKAEIDTELAMEAKAAELADLNDYLNKPEHKVPHGINGDSDDRKRLTRAGWEEKAGVIYAPTSRGELVPMFPSEVLYGDIPRDSASAEYYKTTRAIFSEDYDPAYQKYFRSMCLTRDHGLAMSKLTGNEQKALSEGLDSGGGFLVPPDVQAEMLVRVAQMAIVRKYAKVQTTSRDVLRWPAVAPNTTSGSIYSSGFVGGWAGETPAFSDTDPGFQNFDIAVKKLRVATKLSNDLVADAAVNLMSFMAMNGAENMALVEDNGFLTGDGSSLQPLGILNTGASTVDVEGSTTDTISNTTSNAGSAPKIIDLAYTLPPQYLGNARWLMKRSIEGKVRKLLDASGRFLWPAQTMSAFAAVQRDLLGYPIDNSDFLPSDGTNANKVFIFGDISAYVIAQRAQISTVVLRERFADTDQVGIILFERVGGALWNTDAIRFGIV